MLLHRSFTTFTIIVHRVGWENSDVWCGPCCDCYSRKIVGFCTMPRKNPITILGTIFRPLLLSHGIWNQLRSDHGTEFALVSTVQQYLAHLALTNSSFLCCRRQDRQHRAEILWPEVNSRVNYPIKAVLVRMEAEELIDMRNDLHKFSVSWVTIHVVASPVVAFINAWNSHTIPGRSGGIPDILASRTCRIHGLSPSQVPLKQLISTNPPLAD